MRSSHSFEEYEYDEQADKHWKSNIGREQSTIKCIVLTYEKRDWFERIYTVERERQWIYDLTGFIDIFLDRH